MVEKAQAETAREKENSASLKDKLREFKKDHNREVHKLRNEVDSLTQELMELRLGEEIKE